MFARAASTASRSIRPIARRSFATRSGPTPSPSWWSSERAGAAVAFTTLAVATMSIASERKTLSTPTGGPQESVLAQESLKKPLHKPEVSKDDESEQSEKPEAPSPSDNVDEAADDAAKVLEEKQSEAAEPSAGAYNPETGEINWDCPCLGGMATGPCGEQFKAAFSCFVYSEAEPKGVDCVEKFKLMQDCFREHPEIYGEEIDDDAPAAGSEDEASAPAPQEGEVTEAQPAPENDNSDLATKELAAPAAAP